MEEGLVFQRQRMASLKAMMVAMVTSDMLQTYMGIQLPRISKSIRYQDRGKESSPGEVQHFGLCSCHGKVAAHWQDGRSSLGVRRDACWATAFFNR